MSTARTPSATWPMPMTRLPRSSGTAACAPRRSRLGNPPPPRERRRSARSVASARVIAPLRFQDGVLELLDQTRLPAEEVWLRCTTPAEVADAIARLAVRGAPAIGVAAAYGLVLAEADGFDAAADQLAAARPTAVNLRWAVEQVRAAGPAGAPQGRPAD